MEGDLSVLVPENRITPRIFIAATRMNDGKTTLALGLYSAMIERAKRVGYIKPIGQRFVEVDGQKIDEDSVLINTVFGIKDPISEMSPVAVEPAFTRKYLQSGNHDALVRKVVKAFDRIAWEKEVIIIEGTGHAGVGSVFDLSNARVAKILGSKVILVTQGGIGKPIDEVALNKALFDQMGVELLGVVMNKVDPSKIANHSDIVRKGFARIGVELLGVIPRMDMLESPSLSQISSQLGAHFINGEEHRDRTVERVIVGAMSSRHVMDNFKPNALVITPGDREDLILASLSSSTLMPPGEGIAGIILSDGLHPHYNVLELIRRTNIPVMEVSMDCYTVASMIHDLTIKTRAADSRKIHAIREMIRTHIDIDRLLNSF